MADNKEVDYLHGDFRTFCIKYPYHGLTRNVCVKAIDEDDAEYIRQQIASEGFVDGEVLASIYVSPSGIERVVHAPYDDEEEEPSH